MPAAPLSEAAATTPVLVIPVPLVMIGAPLPLDNTALGAAVFTAPFA